jgi:uncharacterized membrane protein YdbT with pleckstrin-like domain
MHEMGYVDRNLEAGETVRYQTKLHWVVLVAPIVVLVLLGVPGLILLLAAASRSLDLAEPGGAALFGVILFIVPCIGVVLAALNRSSSEFAVTSKRVIIKVGVVRTTTLEIFLNKVESVGVHQGLGGKLFGYGTIVVRGTGGAIQPFQRIMEPLQFRRHVQEQIRRAATGSAP